MFTMLANIIYWTVYSAVMLVVLVFFAGLNREFIMEGWKEYRISAALRLMRMRIKAALPRVKVEVPEGRYEKSTADAVLSSGR